MSVTCEYLITDMQQLRYTCICSLVNLHITILLQQMIFQWKIFVSGAMYCAIII